MLVGNLLSSFGLGWSISIDRVPPSPDMAQSPLQPLLVTATRVHAAPPEQPQQQQQSDEVDGQIDDVNSSDDERSSTDVSDREASAAVPAVQLSFGPEAGLVNSDQLADVIKVWPRFLWPPSVHATIQHCMNKRYTTHFPQD